MGGTAGKDTVVLVDAYDLSEYFRSADSNPRVPPLQATGFGKSSGVYILGAKDGTLALSGFYDTTIGASDEVLRSAFSRADSQVVTVGIAGLAVGDRADALQSRLTRYRKTSPVDGVAAIDVDFQADGGIDLAVVLHDLTEEETDDTGTVHDHGAATTAGAVANLHVTGLVGIGQLDVVIEHSSDQTTWADLIVFTPSTDLGAERLEVTGTVNRYTRARWALTGAGPKFTFAAVLARL